LEQPEQRLSTFRRKLTEELSFGGFQVAIRGPKDLCTYTSQSDVNDPPIVEVAIDVHEAFRLESLDEAHDGRSVASKTCGDRDLRQWSPCVHE